MMSRLSLDVDMTEVADGLTALFLQRLPRACLGAKAGLDPEKTRLMMQVIPECPDGRAFEKQIFMGSGAHSERDCGLLFGKLREALSTLSGMQQNGMMGYEFDEDSDRKDAEMLEAIVRDMAMALTGREIDFRSITTGTRPVACNLGFSERLTRASSAD